MDKLQRVAVITGLQLNKSWRRSTGHQTILLKDADLSIMKGETVALVGPSGSGKSSLLHLCAGLDDHFSGQLTVLEHNLSALKDTERARLRRAHLGFVSQQGGLIQALSVQQNITMPLWLSGKDPDLNRAHQLMMDLDIAHLAQSAPEDLSGGEVSRVALARALQHRPQLLVADEPTHGLDSERKQRVIQLLAREATLGMTLFVATHDALLCRAMDRVLMLRLGKIVDGGTS